MAAAYAGGMSVETSKTFGSGPVASPAPVRDPADLPWHVRHRMSALLLTALIPLGVGAVCFAVVSLVVMGNLRAHPVYTQALAAVRASPAAAAELGGGVEPGWWVMGGEEPDVDGVPRMEVMLNVSGDRAGGGVRAVGRPAAGAPGGWRLTFLDVGVNRADGRFTVVDLVGEEAPVRFGIPE